MATKKTAPKQKKGVSNNSIPYSPWSKQNDPDGLKSASSQPSEGGLDLGTGDPTVGTNDLA